jgi:hypothetical protein
VQGGVCHSVQAAGDLVPDMMTAKAESKPHNLVNSPLAAGFSLQSHKVIDMIFLEKIYIYLNDHFAVALLVFYSSP